jgi:hypothetical protein
VTPAALNIATMSDYIVQFRPFFPGDDVYSGEYPRTISSLQTATNYDFAYAAFSAKHVFLGYLSSFDISSQPINSSFANNFLQASAEIERMVYEVATWNTTRAKKLFVQGSMDAQFYRIAYGP